MTTKNTTKTSVSKAEVARARGKDPGGPPTAGRLKDGKTKSAEDQRIRIPRPDFETAQIVVRGTSPLIVHDWDVKAYKMMLENMMNPKRTKRQKDDARGARDPYGDFLGSLYTDKKGDFAFRSIAFKMAMITSCRHIPDVTMKNMIQCLNVNHEFSPLFGWPMCRLDYVRVGNPPNKTTDLRFRAIFEEWACVLELRYIKSIVELDDVLNLLSWAGDTVGVGEWRVENKGNFGCFEVVGSKEMKKTIDNLGRYNIEDLDEENTGMNAIYDRLGVLRVA